jgi:hypothetical protein
MNGNRRPEQKNGDDETSKQSGTAVNTPLQLYAAEAFFVEYRHII